MRGSHQWSLTDNFTLCSDEIVDFTERSVDFAHLVVNLNDIFFSSSQIYSRVRSDSEWIT